MGGAGECLTTLRVPVEFTGFEAHLLWSILINFGFLSFCGIKVLLLLLLRLSLFFCVCVGSKGLRSQRNGNEGPCGSRSSREWELGVWGRRSQARWRRRCVRAEGDHFIKGPKSR